MKVLKLVRTVLCSTAFALVLLGASPGMSDHYLPGPPSSVSIRTELWDQVPGPIDRKTIGIGECVTLGPGWQDEDIFVHDNGFQEPVQDEMETDAFWSVVTGGGSLMWDYGPWNTYNAPHSNTDLTVQIRLEADDSQQRGIDPTAVGTVTFQVLIPRSIAVCVLGDDPPPRVPGDTYMEAKSWFQHRILPDTVSFRSVTFRYNSPPASRPWPYSNAPWHQWLGWLAQYEVGPGVIGGETVPNVAYPFIVFTGSNPVGYLQENGVWYNHAFQWNVPQEFWSTAGWQQFAAFKAWEDYYGMNPAFRGPCRVGVELGYLNLVWGGFQGPWQ